MSDFPSPFVVRIARIFEKILIGVFLLVVVIAYGYWWLVTDQKGFYESQKMAVLIHSAFDNGHRYQNINKQTKKCDSNLCNLLRKQKKIPNENPIERDRNSLATTNYYNGCPYRWWPFFSCKSIVTEQEIFEHPEFRDLFDKVIKNPCHYLNMTKSKFKTVYLYIPNDPKALFEDFQCHKSQDGNPFTIVVSTYGPISARSNKTSTHIYEATR